MFERSERIGGVWHDNTYPGAACDIPSHLYEFSFAPNPWWSRRYAPQPEIQAYLEQVARSHGVLQRIRTGVEVQRARRGGVRPGASSRPGRNRLAQRLQGLVRRRARKRSEPVAVDVERVSAADREPHARRVPARRWFAGGHVRVTSDRCPTQRPAPLPAQAPSRAPPPTSTLSCRRSRRRSRRSRSIRSRSPRMSSSRLSCAVTTGSRSISTSSGRPSSSPSCTRRVRPRRLYGGRSSASASRSPGSFSARTRARSRSPGDHAARRRTGSSARVGRPPRSGPEPSSA